MIYFGSGGGGEMKILFNPETNENITILFVKGLPTAGAIRNSDGSGKLIVFENGILDREIPSKNVPSYIDDNGKPYFPPAKHIERG